MRNVQSKNFYQIRKREIDNKKLQNTKQLKKICQFYNKFELTSFQRHKLSKITQNPQQYTTLKCINIIQEFLIQNKNILIEKNSIHNDFQQIISLITINKQIQLIYPQIIWFTSHRSIKNRQIPGIRFVYYTQTIKNDKNILKIIDLTQSSQIESILCLYLNEINIIYTNRSLPYYLRKLIKIEDMEQLVLNQKFDVVTTLIKNTGQMQQTIKNSIIENNGDLVIFCDQNLIDQYKKSNKFKNCNSIYANLVVMDILKINYDQSKTNIIFAQNFQQVMNLVNQFKNILKKVNKVFDFMKSRRVYFDFQQEIYIEQIGDVGEEQFKKRRLVIGQYSIGKYYRKKQGRTIKYDQLIFSNLSQIYIKIQKQKIKHLFGDSQQFVQKLQALIQYMKRYNIIDDNQKYIQKQLNYSKFRCLNMNQILGITSTKNTSQFNFYLVIISYIYTTNSTLLLKSNKISQINGDFNLIKQIIHNYQSFQKFVKTQFLIKQRKYSNNSQLEDLDLQKMNSWSKKQSTNKTNDRTNRIKFKFNNIFVLKWWKNYENLSIYYKDIIQQKIKLSEQFQVELFCKKNNFVLIPKQKHYAKINDRNSFFTISKNTILYSTSPLPKYLSIFKIIKLKSDSILISKQIPLNQQSSQIHLQYQHINASIFSKKVLAQFQIQNNCLIQTNQEFQSIIIQCKLQKKQQINIKFRAILQEALQNFKNISLIAKHGQKQLKLEIGGKIRQVLQKSQTTVRIAIRNIPLQWDQNDIKQITQDVITIQQIQLKKNILNQTQDAFLTLGKETQTIALYDLINKYQVEGNKLFLCKPSQIKNPFIKDIKCVSLKWYAYATNKTGEIQFQSHNSVLQACKMFPKYCKHISQQLNSNILILENLQEWIDQQYIKQLFKDVGMIVRIKLKKIAPLEKQIYSLLYYHLGTALSKLDKYTVSNIQITNQESGQRQCTITFDDIHLIDVVNKYFDSKIGLLGKARCYVTKRIQYTLKFQLSIVNLLRKLLEKQVQKFKLNLKLIQFQTVIYEDNGYLTIIAKDIKLFTIILNKAQQLGEGYIIQEDKDKYYLTEYGKKVILSIQERYTCKIRRFQNNKLRVVCDIIYLEQIKKLILNIGEAVLNTQIKIKSRLITHINQNPQIIPKIMTNISYQIKQSELIIDVQGQIKDIVKFKAQILIISQQISIRNHSQDQKQFLCQICQQQYTQIPYMLMICQHSFCRTCIYQYLDSCLGNFSMFPLKCPKCSQLIAINDIRQLCKEANRWQKLKKLSIQQFISKNFSYISHCLTPNCDGIHFITTNLTRCQFCQKQYCMSCKKIFHHGLTCWQASVGVDILFDRFVANNDVRKCPNSKCIAMIHKDGGCNKVLCSLCKLSICWKCMNSYPTPQKAYEHLNQKHGGYFDN